MTDRPDEPTELFGDSDDLDEAVGRHPSAQPDPGDLEVAWWQANGP
jgi:hypothetical protein